MRGVSDRRCASAAPWRADGLSASELIPCQIDLDSRNEPVPHMALDPLSIEIDISAEDVAAEQVLNDERRDVALATARVLGCPSVVFLCRVETPGFAYRMLEVRKSDHGKTVTESNPSAARASCRPTGRERLSGRFERRQPE